MNIQLLEEAIRTNDPTCHFPITELICIENTQNKCGGKVLSIDYTNKVCEMAHAHNIPVHIDGARIWNAAQALNCSVADLTRNADSISVCFSKGLGAPVGSCLVGSKKFIEKAKRVRKSLGGGMRQAGILAAACIQGIEDFENGMLKNDHLNANKLGTQLNNIKDLNVNINSIESNIIILKTNDNIDLKLLCKNLRDWNIIISPRTENTSRLVLHRDIHNDDIDKIIEAFKVCTLISKKA